MVEVTTFEIQFSTNEYILLVTIIFHLRSPFEKTKNESIKELLWTKKEADSAEDYPSTDILFLFCIVHESRSAMFW